MAVFCLQNTANNWIEWIVRLLDVGRLPWFLHQHPTYHSSSRLPFVKSSPLQMNNIMNLVHSLIPSLHPPPASHFLGSIISGGSSDGNQIPSLHMKSLGYFFLKEKEYTYGAMQWPEIEILSLAHLPPLFDICIAW